MTVIIVILLLVALGFIVTKSVKSGSRPIPTYSTTTEELLDEVVSAKENKEFMVTSPEVQAEVNANFTKTADIEEAFSKGLSSEQSSIEGPYMSNILKDCPLKPVESFTKSVSIIKETEPTVSKAQRKTNATVSRKQFASKASLKPVKGLPSKTLPAKTKPIAKPTGKKIASKTPVKGRK